MSRYSMSTDDFTYSWGYDGPLSQYFFQKESKVPLEDSEDDFVFSIANYTSLTPHPRYPFKIKYSTGEILDIMNEEMRENPQLRINSIHIDNMVLDLPF